MDDKGKTLRRQIFQRTHPDSFDLMQFFQFSSTQGIGADHHKESLDLSSKKSFEK